MSHAASGERVRLELHAKGGRAVLVDADDSSDAEFDAAQLGLPESLVTSLHEWARVAGTVIGDSDTGASNTGASNTGASNTGASGADGSAELVSRRGRQLAVRLAVETGGEVGYADPVSGQIARIGSTRTSRTANGQVPSRPRAFGNPLAPPPTPWATGLAVSAIVAALMTVALTVVTVGLSTVNVYLAVGVNLAVAAGFAPSIWLGRRVLVWRWVGFGVAAGIAASWIALLLSLLG